MTSCTDHEIMYRPWHHVQTMRSCTDYDIMFRPWHLVQTMMSCTDHVIMYRLWHHVQTMTSFVSEWLLVNDPPLKSKYIDTPRYRIGIHRTKPILNLLGKLTLSQLIQALRTKTTRLVASLVVQVYYWFVCIQQFWKSAQIPFLFRTFVKLWYTSIKHKKKT